MRILKEPLFLIGDEYCYYDKEEGRFKLTEEGLKNKKVKESYDEFYKELEEMEVKDNNERD